VTIFVHADQELDGPHRERAGLEFVGLVAAGSGRHAGRRREDGQRGG